MDTLVQIRPGIMRFVAIDAHKNYVMVGAVDAHQVVVLKPVRVDMQRFDAWLRANLVDTDAVVIESTSNAWHLHDLLEPIVGQIVIANPVLIKLISQTKVKTDASDTMKLARLLAVGMIPGVWVPPKEIRELRGMIAHRDRLVNTRVQAKNRLHAVLHRLALVPPSGDLFSKKNRAWWAEQTLSTTERFRTGQDLALLEFIEPQVHEADMRLLAESGSERWQNIATHLLQLPGVGTATVMVLMGAIGDITRFETAGKLVGYAGLGAGVHSSGTTHHTGRITKCGRRDLRYAMVESAWTAVQKNAYWKERFEKLCARKPVQKAIVAIARQLLVRVWHLWTHSSIDRNAEVAAVARKMQSWGTRMRKSGRNRARLDVFVRERLDALAIGAELTEVPSAASVKLALPASRLPLASNPFPSLGT